jgi:hypothetical protein
MGLISSLLTLPLQPVRGVVWIAGQTLEEAERVLEEQERPERKLQDLAEDYEAGLISEEEYAEAEEQLLLRLTETTTYVVDEE